MSKNAPQFVILPGLNGTDRLLLNFKNTVSSSLDALIIAYPSDVPMSYDEYSDFIKERIPKDRPIVVLGESFSGPLSIRLTAEHANVKALILCATFVKCPVMPILRYINYPFIFRITLPLRLMQAAITGKHGTPEFIQILQDEIKTIRPDVMSTRIHELIHVDYSDHLASVKVPILYLRANHDRIVRQHCMNTILKVNPNVEIARFDCSHLILQTHPRDAWEQINQFLQRVLSDNGVDK
jgi:pimeloyl-ACP methyl ester carboxylesterase